MAIEKLPVSFEEGAEEKIEVIDIKLKRFVESISGKEGVIDFTQLNKIGAGGSHDVYESKKDPTFVIKVEREAHKKLSTVEDSPKIQQDILDYISRKNKKYEDLESVFGGACLKETIVVLKSKLNDSIRDVPFLIQQRGEGFAKSDKLDLTIHYIESDEEVEGLLTNDAFDEEKFLKKQTQLERVFNLIKSDKDFAEKVKDFLGKAHEYIVKTGQLIDVAGQENVLFYRKDGAWMPQLGSVIKGDTWEQFENAFNKLEESSNLDEEEWSKLKNGIATINLYNALALKLGIKKIFNIELTDRQRKNLKTLLNK